MYSNTEVIRQQRCLYSNFYYAIIIFNQVILILSNKNQSQLTQLLSEKSKRQSLCAMLSRSVTFDSVTPWTVAHQVPLSVGFSRQEYWSGLLCPPPGDLPNPGIGPKSPALQVDSLPSEPPGKPKNTGVGSLSLLQGNFLTQELNWGLLKCRWILYQLSPLAAQFCPTLCSPRDYSPPGPCVHGILQAKVPEQTAISCSRGSS